MCGIWYVYVACVSSTGGYVLSVWACVYTWINMVCMYMSTHIIIRSASE